MLAPREAFEECAGSYDDLVQGEGAWQGRLGANYSDTQGYTAEIHLCLQLESSEAAHVERNSLPFCLVATMSNFADPSAPEGCAVCKYPSEGLDYLRAAGIDLRLNHLPDWICGNEKKALVINCSQRLAVGAEQTNCRSSTIRQGHRLLPCPAPGRPSDWQPHAEPVLLTGPHHVDNCAHGEEGAVIEHIRAHADGYRNLLLQYEGVAGPGDTVLDLSTGTISIGTPQRKIGCCPVRFSSAEATNTEYDLNITFNTPGPNAGARVVVLDHPHSTFWVRERVGAAWGARCLWY